MVARGGLFQLKALSMEDRCMGTVEWMRKVREVVQIRRVG